MSSSSPERSAKTCCVTEERIWSSTGTACSLFCAKTCERRSRHFASAVYDCSCAKSAQSRGTKGKLRSREAQRPHVRAEVQHQAVDQLVHLSVEVLRVARRRLRQQRDEQLQQAQHLLLHLPAEAVRRGVLRDPAQQSAETAEIHRDDESCERFNERKKRYGGSGRKRRPAAAAAPSGYSMSAERRPTTRQEKGKRGSTW